MYDSCRENEIQSSEKSLVNRNNNLRPCIVPTKSQNLERGTDNIDKIP